MDPMLFFKNSPSPPIEGVNGEAVSRVYIPEG